MRPRERVLIAFKKLDGYPDHVPIRFDLCKLGHFGKKLSIEVKRR